MLGMLPVALFRNHILRIDYSIFKERRMRRRIGRAPTAPSTPYPGDARLVDHARSAHAQTRVALGHRRKILRLFTGGALREWLV
jgi:hypothetical protein